MAESLRMTNPILEPVAHHFAELQTLLERVHHQPEGRLHRLARLQELWPTHEQA